MQPVAITRCERRFGTRRVSLWLNATGSRFDDEMVRKWKLKASRTELTFCVHINGLYSRNLFACKIRDVQKVQEIDLLHNANFFHFQLKPLKLSTHTNVRQKKVMVLKHQATTGHLKHESNEMFEISKALLFGKSKNIPCQLGNVLNFLSKPWKCFTRTRGLLYTHRMSEREEIFLKHLVTKKIHVVGIHCQTKESYGDCAEASSNNRTSQTWIQRNVWNFKSSLIWKIKEYSSKRKEKSRFAWKEFNDLLPARKFLPLFVQISKMFHPHSWSLCGTWQIWLDPKNEWKRRNRRARFLNKSGINDWEHVTTGSQNSRKTIIITSEDIKKPTISKWKNLATRRIFNSPSILCLIKKDICAN